MPDIFTLMQIIDIDYPDFKFITGTCTDGGVLIVMPFPMRGYIKKSFHSRHLGSP